MQNEIQEAKEWFAVEIDLSSHYMEDGVYPEMYAAAKSRKRRYELALAALEQQERDEHIISHYKDCFDITDRSLKRVVADRDAWKARAEEYESVLRQAQSCAVCIHWYGGNGPLGCTIGGGCRGTKWQFDEQRFGKEIKK